MSNPDATTTYVSTILKGESSPIFRVVAQDNPQNPIMAPTATGAWSIVVKSMKSH